MSNKLDVLFINPGNQNAIYQDLAKDYSAIETPTWAHVSIKKISQFILSSKGGEGVSREILDLLTQTLKKD